MKGKESFSFESFTKSLIKKPKPLHFRTIWTSDVHLGISGCQAKRLLSDFVGEDHPSLLTQRTSARSPKNLSQ